MTFLNYNISQVIYLCLANKQNLRSINFIMRIRDSLLTGFLNKFAYFLPLNNDTIFWFFWSEWRKVFLTFDCLSIKLSFCFFSSPSKSQKTDQSEKCKAERNFCWRWGVSQSFVLPHFIAIVSVNLLFVWNAVRFQFNQISGMIIVNVFSSHVRNFAVESEERFLCCRCRCCCCWDGHWRFGFSRSVDLNVVLVRRPVVGHLEDHLHVVRGAASANTTMKIFGCGGWNEIIILAGSEFKTARGGGKWSEGDGEVHQPVRLVANGNNLRLGVGDSARVKLLAAYAVDDVRFRISHTRFWDWTDDVDLVVLPRLVARVDIDNVIGVVKSEHWVGSVPVNVMNLSALAWRDRRCSEEQNDDKNIVAKLHLGKRLRFVLGRVKNSWFSMVHNFNFAVMSVLMRCKNPCGDFSRFLSLWVEMWSWKRRRRTSINVGRSN